MTERNAFRYTGETGCETHDPPKGGGDRVSGDVAVQLRQMAAAAPPGVDRVPQAEPESSTYPASRSSNSKRAELVLAAGFEIGAAESRTCSGSGRPDSTTATVPATGSAVESRSDRCSLRPEIGGALVRSQRTSSPASPHGVAPRQEVR